MSGIPIDDEFSEHEPLKSETSDLEQFGYKQELRRGLGFTSTFSAAFSYMSPTTGIFGVFAIGFSILGGAMIWAWPIVFIGQMFVALGFAEMASHYPLAGSVFQWTKFLSPSKGYTWFTSWIYVWAGALTTAAVIATMPVVLIPLLAKMGWNIAGTTAQQQLIAFITLVVVLLINVFGVKIAAAVNNIGVAFELLALVVFAAILAIFHHHHGVSVVTDTGGHGFSLGGLGLALFVGLWVMYGMDTASTLAEESHSPRTIAPKAVIVSLVGAFATGGIFLLALLMAVPGDIGKATAAGISPSQIIEANLSSAWSITYLIVINIAVFVTCVAIMTSLIRLVFGMARDGQLPLSRRYSSVNRKTGTPIGASIVAALTAAVFLLQYKSAGIVAIAATAVTYVAYLLANLALFRARSRGWPEAHSPFKLKGWGMPVTVIAIGFEVLMLVNLFWPRAITNPAPNQTGGALDLGIPLLNRIPIDWTVLLVVVLAGLVYYGLRKSTIRDPRQVPSVVSGQAAQTKFALEGEQ